METAVDMDIVAQYIKIYLFIQNKALSLTIMIMESVSLFEKFIQLYSQILVVFTYHDSGKREECEMRNGLAFGKGTNYFKS